MTKTINVYLKEFYNDNDVGKFLFRNTIKYVSENYPTSIRNFKNIFLKSPDYKYKVTITVEKVRDYK